MIEQGKFKYFDYIPVKHSVFLKLFLATFIVLAPLSVTSANKIILVFLFGLCLLAIIFSSIIKDNFKLTSKAKILINSYLSVYLVGIISSIFHINILYGDYISSVFSGRLFTLIVFFTVLFYTLASIESLSRITLFLYGRLAFIVLFLFVIVGGFWQLTSFYTPIPFPFETRTWLHGVPASIAAILPQRLTSFAEEPNFFAPIIIEFLILARLFFSRSKLRKPFIYMGLFVLGMTFSAGAYVNLILIVSFYILVNLKDSLKKGDITKFQVLFISTVLILLLLILQFGGVLIDYIVAKFSNEVSGGSSRSQFLKSLTLLWLDGSAWQLLFGRGVATLSVLPVFGMEQSDFLFRISNNMFLDIIWESGLIGFFLLLFTFVPLFLRGYKNRSNIFYESGMLLTVHLFITSLYRSEYLSMHFLWLIVLIFVCYKIGNDNPETFIGS